MQVEAPTNQAQLQAEQVAVLFRNLPAALVANAVNASVLASVQWPVVSHIKLIAWVIVMWTITGIRAVFVLKYRRSVPSSLDAFAWYRWMLASTTLSGIGWGTTVLFLTPEIPLAHEVIQTFILGGMVAGAVAVLSVSFVLFASYSLPLSLPILGHLLLSGYEFHLTMGVICTFFLFATLYSAWNFNQVLLSSITLRLDNLSLINSLTTRTEAVERLNRDITREIAERRLIEDRLRTAHDDLERRIAERTAELARANANLQAEIEDHCPQSALPIVSRASEDQSATEVILLVEDEPSVRQLTQHILRTQGYAVLEAESGEQALDVVRHDALHVDLVITDLVMPGMNGRDLIRRLREHFGALKVLYMSGYSDSTPITGEDSKSEAAFLAKPFTPDDLIKKIHEILHPPLSF